jgi:hypothetical protein
MNLGALYPVPSVRPSWRNRVIRFRWLSPSSHGEEKLVITADPVQYTHAIAPETTTCTSTSTLSCLKTVELDHGAVKAIYQIVSSTSSGPQHRAPVRTLVQDRHSASPSLSFSSLPSPHRRVQYVQDHSAEPSLSIGPRSSWLSSCPQYELRSTAPSPSTIPGSSSPQRRAKSEFQSTLILKSRGCLSSCSQYELRSTAPIPSADSGPSSHRRHSVEPSPQRLAKPEFQSTLY